MTKLDRLRAARAEILAAVEMGETADALARRYGVNSAMLVCFVAGAGGRFGSRGPRTDKARAAVAIEQHKAGMSVYRVAEDAGVSRQTVYGWIRRHKRLAEGAPA